MSRRLPSVDQVLTHEATEPVVRRWGLATTKEAVRAVQAELRGTSDIPEWGADSGGYADALTRWLATEVGHGYETVFNLTGTIIHTNLGRALLDPEMLAGASRQGDPADDPRIRPSQRRQRRTGAHHPPSAQVAHGRGGRNGRSTTTPQPFCWCSTPSLSGATWPSPRAN